MAEAYFDDEAFDDAIDDALAYMDASAERIAAGYARGVGVDSGELQESIFYQREEGAFEGLGGATAAHAEYHEYGTAPHVIRPLNGQALAFGGMVVAQVNHPGTAPNPALRAAIEQETA